MVYNKIWSSYKLKIAIFFYLFLLIFFIIGRVDVVGFAEDKIEVVFSKESGFEGPITISENELVKGNSWSSFDLFPRFLKDYNEDGKADILAISSSAVITKLSKGTETLDTSNIYLISKFGYTDSTGLYSTFDKSPR